MCFYTFKCLKSETVTVWSVGCPYTFDGPARSCFQAFVHIIMIEFSHRAKKTVDITVMVETLLIAYIQACYNESEQMSLVGITVIC